MRLSAVAAVTLLLALSACTSTSRDAVPGPGDPTVAVDTPELVSLKSAAGIEPCVPGTATSKLPAVTLACLGGGQSVDLSTLSGPLILNFWYAGCGPCRLEMPILGDFARAHGAQVPIIGIDSLDTVPGKAIELAGKRKATYPQLADPAGDLLTEPVFANANKGNPYTVFVGADGTVKGEQVGGIKSLDELTGLVDDYLGLQLAAP